MSSLPKIAGKWFRKTDIHKGIQLNPEEMDILNSIGVGQLIAEKLAEHQRALCLKRNAESQSINGGLSVSIDGQTVKTSKSPGMTQRPGGSEALARVQRMLSER